MEPSFLLSAPDHTGDSLVGRPGPAPFFILGAVKDPELGLANTGTAVHKSRNYTGGYVLPVCTCKWAGGSPV